MAIFREDCDVGESRKRVSSGMAHGTISATAAVAAGSLVTNADLENIAAQVNTKSSPAQLKITDTRIAHSERSMLMRLDTNQGISGYGEIRYDARIRTIPDAARPPVDKLPPGRLPEPRSSQLPSRPPTT
jgi:hypothetical protein